MPLGRPARSGGERERDDDVFELAKRNRTLSRIVYASSVAAVAGGTLYAVFKRANEGSASVYWKLDGVSSIDRTSSATA